MNTRRCPECRGIPVLGDDGLYCYSCGRAIHDPQKRLGAWRTDEEDDKGQQSSRPVSPRGKTSLCWQQLEGQSAFFS